VAFTLINGEQQWRKQESSFAKTDRKRSIGCPLRNNQQKTHKYAKSP